MSTVNIRRDVTDKYYRYKMPKLVSKIEGRGNGIKTVIPNMSDIAKALSRPPTYPTKFFGCELGSQVKCDDKNDRYIVNGAHDAEKLAALLDVFIEKFVLCPSCKNPETDLVFTKTDDIIRDCQACGAHLPVDMRHKLVTFILKNRPESAKKKRQGKASETPADSEDDEEAAKELQQEAAGLASATNDDDWGEDTNPEAVAARMKELSVGGAVSKLMGEDDEDDEDDPLNVFGNAITPDISDEEVVAKSADLRHDKVVAILMQTIFDANILTKKQLVKRNALFKKFIKGEKDQKAVLGGMERLVGMVHPDLLSKTPLILKALYDLEYVDEDVFLAWGDKISKKYVDKKLGKEIREKAAPFLNWLKEAESEEDD